MKVTRDIIDNGKKIIHINYTKEDIAKAKKRAAEAEAKCKAEQDAREAENKA